MTEFLHERRDFTQLLSLVADERGLDPFPDPKRRPTPAGDHSLEQHLVECHVHVSRMRRRGDHVPLHLAHPIA